MEHRYRRVTVVLDEQLTLLIDQHAQGERTSRSAIVRSALASFCMGVSAPGNLVRIAESSEWSRILLETIIDISAPGRRAELVDIVAARMCRFHGSR